MRLTVQTNSEFRISWTRFKQSRSKFVLFLLSRRPATVDMKKMKTEVIEMTVKQTSHDIARIVEERVQNWKTYTHYKQETALNQERRLKVTRNLEQRQKNGDARNRVILSGIVFRF